MLFCAVLTTSFADPEPKKYKVQKKKNNTANTTLTEDEKKFLREVEAKFGIKADGNDDSKKENGDDKKIEATPNQGDLKLPFPAVIAIEIVNDTDSKGKGKRTIDANLGYGYKTNSGYSYSYFGKPVQDKGKFMIYPYSQEDIPPGGHKHGSTITQVEIQPSKAFELVKVKDENEGYHYPKPSTGTKTNYDNVKGLVSPPPSYSQNQNSHGGSQSFIPSTLFTTYNGHEFSGLSGQFPSVKQNYFIDPSQLLKTPEYQNVGLTNDHLRIPESKVADHRVVPVLVLRVPSSSLKNPTAELFANLPSNYPLSRYLNNVNLQDLVNQYFKKMGFSFAPPIMSYQSSITSHAAETPSVSSQHNYGRQQYASPYVQPTYSHSDHSGVQYSAVQPVMAKYPSVYPQRYVLSPGHSLYHQPMHQQKYEYRYRYVPQTAAAPQTYYVQSNHYQQQQQSHEAPASVEANSQETSSEEYGSAPQVHTHGQTGHYEYRTPQVQHHQAPKAAYEYIKHDNVESASPSYEHLRNIVSASPAYESVQHVESASPTYGHLKNTESVSPSFGHLRDVESASQSYESLGHISSPSYEHSDGSEGAQQYYTRQQEAIASYPAQSGHSEMTHSDAHSHAQFDNTQNYQYQQEGSSEESDDNGLILSENYPSKDHTIAKVYPVNSQKSKIQNTGTVQTVSYVTPMPHSSRYQSPYKIMVPQTFLMNPSTEKVAYVHSHSVSAYTQADPQGYSSEEEYTASPHYVPPISKQKAPSYPRNYHSHPKRSAKPDRPESTASFTRKHNERNENKKA